MTYFRRITAGALVIATAAVTTAVLAADISGAGATFPFPIYSKWAAAYKAQTGVGLKWDPLESTCRHASLSIL